LSGVGVGEEILVGVAEGAGVDVNVAVSVIVGVVESVIVGLAFVVGEGTSAWGVDVSFPFSDRGESSRGMEPQAVRKRKSIPKNIAFVFISLSLDIDSTRYGIEIMPGIPFNRSNSR
jgi:hypothetical protein